MLERRQLAPTAMSADRLPAYQTAPMVHCHSPSRSWYQLILLGGQRHVHVKQLGQGCYVVAYRPGEGEPATFQSRSRRPTIEPPRHVNSIRPIESIRLANRLFPALTSATNCRLYIHHKQRRGTCDTTNRLYYCTTNHYYPLRDVARPGLLWLVYIPPAGSYNVSFSLYMYLNITTKLASPVGWRGATWISLLTSAN